MTTPETLDDQGALLDALLLERFGRRASTRARSSRFFGSPDSTDTRECPFSLPRTTRDSPGVLDRFA
jgi:hypothetical protein